MQTPDAAAGLPQHSHNLTVSGGGVIRQTKATASVESAFLRGRPPPSPQSGLYNRPRSGSASSRSSSATGSRPPPQQQRLRSPKDTQRSSNNSPSAAPSPVHGTSRPHSTESAQSNGSSSQGRPGSGGNRCPQPLSTTGVGGVWSGKVASRGHSPSSPSVHRNDTNGSHKAMVAPPVGRGVGRSRHNVLRQRATLGIRTGVRVLPWQENASPHPSHQQQDGFLPVPLSSAAEDFVSQEAAVDQWDSSSSSSDDDDDDNVAVATTTRVGAARAASKHTFDDENSDDDSSEEDHEEHKQTRQNAIGIVKPHVKTNSTLCDHNDDTTGSDEEDSDDEEFEIVEQMAAPRLSCAAGGEFAEFNGAPPAAQAVGVVSRALCDDDDDDNGTGPCFAEKYRRSVQSLGQLNASQPFRFA